MKIPFTIDQFLAVFGDYNQSIWPWQIVLNALAVLLVVAVLKKWTFAARLILYSLSFLWLWMAFMYHYLFFSQINPISKVFSVLFIAQALIFSYLGYQKNLDLEIKLDYVGVIGSLLIVYALLAYPVLGYILGRSYPKAPTFGVPCPTTIFTFGILLFSRQKIFWPLLVIPFIWSLVGFSAAWSLGMVEDYGLVISGLFWFGTQFVKKQESIRFANH